jgi:hypothetical protein
VGLIVFVIILLQTNQLIPLLGVVGCLLMSVFLLADFPVKWSNQSPSLTTIFYNVEAFQRLDPRAILTAVSQMPFHETFREMDMDSSRDLRKEEIRDVLHKQGDDVDEVELNTLFSAMDLNHDGSVSFMEANAHQERELQVIMESLNQPYP